MRLIRERTFCNVFVLMAFYMYVWIGAVWTTIHTLLNEAQCEMDIPNGRFIIHSTFMRVWFTLFVHFLGYLAFFLDLPTLFRTT